MARNRTSRFSSVIHVPFPDAKARAHYLDVKFGNEVTNAKEWVEKTEGFSIDDLKEVVLAVTCLDQNIDEVVDKIKKNKKGVNQINSPNEMPFENPFIRAIALNDEDES